VKGICARGLWACAHKGKNKAHCARALRHPGGRSTSLHQQVGRCRGGFIGQMIGTRIPTENASCGDKGVRLVWREDVCGVPLGVRCPGAELDVCSILRMRLGRSFLLAAAVKGFTSCNTALITLSQY